MRSKKITWQAYDHIKEERSSDWYWIVGIVSVSIAILAIFFNNILFALIVILGAFVSIILSHTKPKILNYEINRRGVKIGDILYTYGNLETFYVIDEDGYDRDRILLKSKKMFMPLIVIPIGENADPDSIRDFLIEYLDEEEMYEPMSDRIANWLGF